MSGQLLDLLYPENRAARVKEIGKYFLAESVVLPEKVHRVTLFLTFRCNLRCKYCNTVLPNPENRLWPAKGKDLELPTFKRIIDGLVPHGVQHLHLTGGEVTLVKDLPEMIAYASHCGIPCSITTNGTSNPALYRELVRSGLREVRISCDTHEPEDFDKTVGRKGYYERVTESVRELVRLRDEERERIYIVINMCVGFENREKIVEAVQQSIAMQPDDVKLIAISDERLDLGAFGDRKRIIDHLEGYLSDFPPERFPLLRRKINSVFSQDTYGLEDLTSKKLIQNCFVPLTERVYDSEYYYPCPVYVREGGRPLGRIDEDDMEVQQKKTLEFARGTSCLSDEICIKSCVYCCKKFNQHANAEIHGRVINPSGKSEVLSVTATFKGNISNAQIFQTMRTIDEERKVFRRDLPYVPFLIIKPSGWTRRHEIRRILTKNGASIREFREIDDWHDMALRLYSYPLTDWRVYRGLLLKEVLPAVEGTSKAEVLFLERRYSFEGLAALKRSLRTELPPIHCLVLHGEDVMVTSLGHVHTPDGASYWLEANLVFQERSR